MAEMIVVLEHGLKIGDAVLKKAIIREAIAGDIMEAQEDSEKLMMVPSATGMEAQFVTSPALMTGNVLRRQIKAIDDYSGPLTMDELKKLHPQDMNALLDAQQQLEQASNATLEAVAKRGRTDSNSDTD